MLGRILVFTMFCFVSATTYILSSDKVKQSVPDNPEEICPILLGNQFPNVNFTAIDGIPFNVDSALRAKPTALIYYRGGWDPFCNQQMLELIEADKYLEPLGYQIFAISADRPARLKESLDKHHMKYILLSDSTMQGAIELGIAYNIGDKMYESYKKYGLDFEEITGLKHHILPVPAVFIIDKNKIIQFEYVNPNPKKRLDPNMLVQAARIIR